MQELWAYLQELNLLSVAVRVILSIVLAGLIGLERQGQHHPAGLRTHILVCVGSALTMMLGQYLFLRYGTDPSRIGAQVVSGIGFLGVGTIILNGAHVRGITTAAGLWASACMGLAVGAGFYEGAIIGFAAIAFTLIIMRRVRVMYYKRHPRIKCLSVRLHSIADLLPVTKLLKAWGVVVSNTNIDNTSEDTDDEGVLVKMDIVLKNDVDSNALMLNLLQESSVLYADYITGD